MGGVIPAIESGYMKSALVRSMCERMSAINTGEQIVVGLNRWTDGIPSPLLGGDDGGLFKVDESAFADAVDEPRPGPRRPATRPGPRPRSTP